MPKDFAIYPSLKGKVVNITGGASGIGLELVRAFTGQGSKVGFVDIDEAGGAAVAKELVDKGSTVAFERCDLRDIDQLKRAFAGLKAALGPASVLINNAARDDRHAWQDVTSDFYDERIAVNLKHMFFATQAVAPDMISA